MCFHKGPLCRPQGSSLVIHNNPYLAVHKGSPLVFHKGGTLCDGNNGQTKHWFGCRSVTKRASFGLVVVSITKGPPFGLDVIFIIKCPLLDFAVFSVDYSITKGGPLGLGW